jgi:hypothetical protein
LLRHPLSGHSSFAEACTRHTCYLLLHVLDVTHFVYLFVRCVPRCSSEADNASLGLFANCQMVGRKGEPPCSKPSHCGRVFRLGRAARLRAGLLAFRSRRNRQRSNKRPGSTCELCVDLGRCATLWAYLAGPARRGAARRRSFRIGGAAEFSNTFVCRLWAFCLCVLS